MFLCGYSPPVFESDQCTVPTHLLKAELCKLYLKCSAGEAGLSYYSSNPGHLAVVARSLLPCCLSFPTTTKPPKNLMLMPQRPLNKAGAARRRFSVDAKYQFCSSMAKSCYSPCFILLLPLVYFLFQLPEPPKGFIQIFIYLVRSDIVIS